MLTITPLEPHQGIAQARRDYSVCFVPCTSMTDRYAVIGHPIAHSRSPDIHAAFARSTGQDLRYDKIESPLDAFEATVLAFRDAGGKGLNVTVPFKTQAFALATNVHEAARIAGAANALKFVGERIEAHNFDGSGLVRDIEHNLGVVLRGQRVLLLGAGGAARGVAPALLAAGVAQLTMANRTAAGAHQLAQTFSALGPVLGCGLNDLASSERFDIVLNSTSAALQGQTPNLPASVLRHAALAYELAYGKGLTPFLRAAQLAGAARLADGVGMLVEQAAETFFWWRGVRPDTRAVIDQLASPLV
jgi:shikimate dehydrogenase